MIGIRSGALIQVGLHLAALETVYEVFRITVDRQGFEASKDRSLCSEMQRLGMVKRTLPDGQITSTLLAHNLSTPSDKNIPLKPVGQIKGMTPPVSPMEGRIAIVTNAG